MALTGIGSQLTPATPIEITFAASLGLPSDVQEMVLIGHKLLTPSGSQPVYKVVTINNVADAALAKVEAEEKFGAGSEISKMIIAAAKANAGRSNFAAIKAIALDSADTEFGPADEALTALAKVKADIIVSPYDGATDLGNVDKIEAVARLMSGASRVDNNQFGSVAIAANQSVTDPSNLPSKDSQFFAPVYLRDSAPTLSLGELAAAYAAIVAGNAFPFNPLRNVALNGVPAPADSAENLSFGAGLESETALVKGWSPLKVLPNGSVTIQRSRTSRITTGDGITTVSSYFDIQDFQVLYFWRKTIFTRNNQSDFTQIKASADAAKKLKGEMIRLAKIFESQNAFQAVDILAPKFLVERNASDRSRLDYVTPTNVIPGLYVTAGNIVATTEGDTLTI